MFSRSGTEVIDEANEERKIEYETVARGFHSGAVTSMEISLQRPIIATFSKDDCTIRIWNYLSGQCMLSRKYYMVAASTQAVDPEHAMKNP